MSGLSLSLDRMMKSGNVTAKERDLEKLKKNIDTFNLSHRHAHNFINMSLVKLKGEVPLNMKQLGVLLSIKSACERFGLTDLQKERVSIDSSNSDFNIEVDTRLFDNIIFNLLKNAFYFIAKSGKGDIQIAFVNADESNEVHFTDFGSGIPESIQMHVFDKFYSQRQNGTGLGLSYCKDTMEAFGGSIALDSEEGLYTKFILKFPKVTV